MTCIKTVMIGSKLQHAFVMEIGLVPHSSKPDILVRSHEYQAYILSGNKKSKVSFTAGIPQAFVDEWFKQNADLIHVKSGSIFIANEEHTAYLKQLADYPARDEQVNELEGAT